MIRIKIPEWVVKTFQQESSVTSLTIKEFNVSYNLTAALISSIPYAIVEKRFWEKKLPNSWFEEVSEVDDIFNFNDYDYAVAVVKKSNCTNVIMKYKGWTNKYFVTTISELQDPVVKTGLFRAVNSTLLMNDSNLMEFDRSKLINMYGPDAISKVMIPVYNLLLTDDIYNDPNSIAKNNGEITIAITRDYDGKQTHHNGKEIIGVAYDYAFDLEAFYTIVNSAAVYKVEKHSDLVEAGNRLEALMSIKDDTKGSKDILKIDNSITVVESESVKKSKEGLRNNSTKRVDQHIPIEGIKCHHGFSRKGVLSNKIKIPRDLTFMKFMLLGNKKKLPFLELKYFKFTQEGFISALVNRENQIIKDGNYLNELYLNDYVRKFVEIVGADEFIKIHNVVPYFDFIKVATDTCERFFNKRPYLANTHRNRVENVLPGSTMSRELLNLEHKGFIFYIKALWSNRLVKDYTTSIRFVDIINEDTNLGVPEEALNSYVAFMDNIPLFYSTDVSQVEETCKNLSNFLNMIDIIHDKLYLKVEE